MIRMMLLKMIQRKNKVLGYTGMMRRYVTMVLAGVLCLLGMVSCGGTDEAEIGAALAELLPASYPLNEIYFGEGLPISDNREDVEKFYAATGAGNDISLNYHPVSPDAIYTSIDQIKEATLLVFSDAYAEYLFTMAFAGLSTVFDEGTETQVTQTVSYARYMETDGYFTVRMDIAKEAFPVNRTYDATDFEVVRERDGYILVDVQSYVDGEKDVRVEVKLVRNGEGEFRLDSPTY